MIKDKLKELFLDKAMLTEVKDGLIAHLQRAALEDVFGGTELFRNQTVSEHQLQKDYQEHGVQRLYRHLPFFILCDYSLAI